MGYSRILAVLLFPLSRPQATRRYIEAKKQPGARAGGRLGAGPLAHQASASKSLTGGSAPSTRNYPSSESSSRLAASTRCAATARRAVQRRTYACAAAPRSSSGTWGRRADKQAAAPAPEELSVSVAALAAADLAQGKAGFAVGPIRPRSTVSSDRADEGCVNRDLHRPEWARRWQQFPGGRPAPARRGCGRAGAAGGAGRFYEGPRRNGRVSAAQARLTSMQKPQGGEVPVTQRNGSWHAPWRASMARVGTDAPASMLQAAAELDADTAVVPSDGKCAYDTVSRAAFLSKLVDVAPPPLCAFDAARASTHTCGGTTQGRAISQGEGCEQGGPWFLLCLRLRRMTCCKLHEGDWLAAFLD